MIGLLCFGLSASAGTLELSSPESEHSFVLDTRVDIALAAVVTSGAVGLMVIDHFADPSPRAQVEYVDPLAYGTPYDDGVFGQVRFEPDRRWKQFSDLALFGLPVVALLTPSSDIGRRGGLRRMAGRKLVVYESLALTAALTSAGKNAFQRPRPFALYAPSADWQGPGDVYSEDIYEACEPELGCTFRDRDVFWSFPSGHTSIVTAAAVSWYTTELLAASGKRRWRWFGLAAPLTLGGLAGHARVRAGKHRPSDVTAGWLLGAVVGLAVPLTHDRGIRLGQGPGDVGLAIRMPLGGRPSGL